MVSPSRCHTAPAAETRTTPSARRDVTLALWSAGTWVILTASTVIVSALIFRELGAAQFGIWATIVVFRGLLALVDAGLAPIVTRETSQLAAGVEMARERIRSARSVYTLAAAFVLALGVAGAGLPGSLLGLQGANASAAAIVTALMAAEAALALFGGTYPSQVRARERFDLLAAAAALQAVTTLVIAFATVDRLGLAGVALGTLAGRAAWLAFSYLWLRTAARELLVPVGVRAMRPVLWATAPIWLTMVLAEAAIRMDAPIVGGFFGPDAAAHYALGAGLPALAVGLLYVLIDTAFPRIAAVAARGGPAALAPTLPLACALGALGFIVLATQASAYLTVWVGTAPALSVAVTALYAAAWLVNIPAHVLMLFAIARNAHRAVVPIQIGEAVANLALSIALAAAGLALGPAIATLSTMAVSNLVIVPLVLLPRLGIRAAAFARQLAGGYLLGAAVALPICLAAAALGAPAPVTAAAAFAGVAGGAGLLAALIGRWTRASLGKPAVTGG